MLYYSNVITVGSLETCWRNNLKSETFPSLNADMYQLETDKCRPLSPADSQKNVLLIPGWVVCVEFSSQYSPNILFFL